MPGIYGLLKRTPATKTKPGAVKQAAKQAAAAGANPTKAEFDALITKLVNAGIMAAN